MAFAGGAYAYPGGGVDPRDERPVALGRAVPRPVGASGSASTAAHAQAVVCAAVRETFEESGVLLAGPDAAHRGRRHHGRGLGGRPPRPWSATDLAFADFLARRGLVLRSDLLGPWARWITPEFEDRRYDTWFFVAAAAAGASAPATSPARPTARSGCARPRRSTATTRARC